MDHPDIVVQFNARVAPASHADKSTLFFSSSALKVPDNQEDKHAKTSTIKSCLRHLSEVHDAEKRGFRPEKGAASPSGKQLNDGGRLEYPTSVET